MQNPAPNRAKLIGIATLLLIGVFYAGFAVGERHRPQIELVTELQNKNAPPALEAIVDFSPFWSAWNVLNQKFVAATTTSVSPQDKVWGAISGLAASLKDPYTVFMPPEEAKIFES